MYYYLIPLNTYIAHALNKWLLIPPVPFFVNLFGAAADVWVIVFGLAYMLFASYQGEKFSIDRIKQRIFETARAAFVIGSLWAFAWVIKTITFIPRPYIAFLDIIPLFTEPPGFDSLPSGHATLFFALATVIFMNHKKMGIVFYVLAILISISRVIAGVHYIGDIAVGAIIGILGAYLVGYIFDKTFPKIKKYFVQ